MRLHLWSDEDRSNVWQLYYPSRPKRISLVRETEDNFGKKQWAEWKIPNFVGNELWYVGKTRNSLPILGAEYLPPNLLIFGLVFEDDSMKDFESNDPLIVTKDQIDSLFTPRPYFHSTPFVENYTATKYEIGAIPEEE